MEINSSSRVVDERKILDAGFLELVRLGIKGPRDPLIVGSLKLIDQLIKVRTPVGDAWYRYNHDAYGETPTGGNYDARNGVGRLWTLLTANAVNMSSQPAISLPHGNDWIPLPDSRMMA